MDFAGQLAQVRGLQPLADLHPPVFLILGEQLVGLGIDRVAGRAVRPKNPRVGDWLDR